MKYGYLCTLVVGLGLLGFPAPAQAVIISISATDFVRHCPNLGCSGQDGTVVEGGMLRLVDDAVFYRSLTLPQGQFICSFALVYNDLNANDTLTARLLRKPFSVNGSPNNGPAVLATANSAAGTPDTIRKATDATVGGNPINNTSAFYFIELKGPTFNLNAVGVQLDVRPSCT